MYPWVTDSRTNAPPLNGTKDCRPSCTAKLGWSSYGPLPANVCAGTPFAQIATRTCTNVPAGCTGDPCGARGGTVERKENPNNPIIGAKSCPNPCAGRWSSESWGPWSSWTPALGVCGNREHERRRSRNVSCAKTNEPCQGAPQCTGHKPPETQTQTRAQQRCLDPPACRTWTRSWWSSNKPPSQVCAGSNARKVTVCSVVNEPCTGGETCPSPRTETPHPGTWRGSAGKWSGWSGSPPSDCSVRTYEKTRRCLLGSCGRGCTGPSSKMVRNPNYPCDPCRPHYGPKEYSGPDPASACPGTTVERPWVRHCDLRPHGCDPSAPGSIPCGATRGEDRFPGTKPSRYGSWGAPHTGSPPTTCGKSGSYVTQATCNGGTCRLQGTCRPGSTGQQRKSYSNPPCPCVRGRVHGGLAIDRRAKCASAAMPFR